MKSIQIDTFLKFKYPGNIQVSPNGQVFGYLVAQAQLEKNHYDYTLTIHNGQKQLARRSIGQNCAYLFLSDTTVLLNWQKNQADEKSLKDEHRQSHYVYDFVQRSLQKSFTLPFPAVLEKRLNNAWLLLSSQLTDEDHQLYEASDDDRMKYIKEKKANQAFEVIDQLPYQANGRGFTTDLKKQLFLYNHHTQAIVRVTEKSRHITAFTVSDDAQTLYYAATEPSPVMAFTAPVYAYDIAHKTERILYAQHAYNIVALIELSGQLIAAARDMKLYGMSQNVDFFRVENNQLIPFAKHGQSFGNTVGSDCRFVPTPTAAVDNHTYYFTTTIDDHNELCALHADGTLETALVMEGSIDGFVPFKEGALLVGMQRQSLQEIYYYHFKNQSLKRLSHLNTAVLKGHYVAQPHVIEVIAKSHTVKGFVLLPKGYDELQTYPAILNIHGGPKTVYGQVYYHEMQAWANEGYIVCFANPRGSDGKGNDFADLRGRYGSIDYQDLMAFTDAVLERWPNIDRNQLFVTGGSYGGFMTNWIVGKTQRFKAAVTQRSISNWLSFYGTSDIGYYFASDQTAGHPIVDREKLYNQSPIKYAAQVKTPLLFIHSDQDHRCPMEQAQQFYAVLKTQGLDTKLVWFKGENHELSRGGKPQARIKRLTEITDWFKRYTCVEPK